MSGSFLIQADDLDEAEEKVTEYLDGLYLHVEFWIEEMSDPFDVEDYYRQLEETDQEIPPLLDEMTEEEFKEFIAL